MTNSEPVVDISMNSKNTILSLLLFPLPVLASATDNTLAMLGSELLYLEDMPVVISATRLAQPLNESPISTTVIDRQMIDASGAQTIADLLRLVPGFTVGYIAGNLPVATYHGQSDRYSKRIQLVIDGRSVYLPTLSGVSWSDLVIGMEDIQRIEVVRGPNASSYGNNAFHAVVSITTKHAAEDTGHSVKVNVGSHDTRNTFYRFADQTEDLDYRVSIGTKNDEGTDLLDDFTDSNYLNYRLDMQLGESTQLFYQGGYQDSLYGDLIENSTDIDNEIEVETTYQHLKLEHHFTSQNSLTLQYYYNYTRSFDSNYETTVSPADFSPLLANLDDFDIYSIIALKSERHDLELAYYYQPLDNLRLVSGASIRADSVDAEQVFDPAADDTLLLYRAFTHGEYSISRDWLLNAGVMIEKNDISGTDTAPRLSLIHHLDDQHSFRVNVSRATRTPTLFDEYGNFAIRETLTQDGGQPLTNPVALALLGGSDTLVNSIFYTSGNVDSEEITSYELGWVAQLLDHKLMLDFKLFRDISTDLIADIPFIGTVPEENIDQIEPGSIGATDIANAAETRIQGFEAYSDYHIDSDLRLYGFLSYAEIEATKINQHAEDSVVGRLEESVPRRSYGAMLMKQWPDMFNTSLAIYHVSDMDWLDRTHNRSNPVGSRFTDRSAEQYTRVDLVLRKSHKIGRSLLSYSVILQNINGEHADYTRSNYTDASFSSIKVPGSIQDPRGYFELSFKFN